jgi:hypothetical protein
MAGDWLKIEKATARKPEVCGIAGELGISLDEAFGICFRFWCWVDDNFTTNAASVSETSIDALVGRSGFAAAMKKVGWLESDEQGIKIPNFDRHLSKGAKTRGQTAKRVESHAKNKREKRYDANAESVSFALAEKRREDMNTDMGVEKKSPLIVKAQPKTEIPEELDTPEFQATWAEWVQHRIELKKPMKPTSAKTLLKTLAKAGERKAIESITHSIANGWQGVFEPSAGAVGKQGDMFSGIRSFMEDTDEQGRFFTGADDAGSHNGSQGASRASVRVVQNLLGSDAGAVGNRDQ